MQLPAAASVVDRVQIASRRRRRRRRRQIIVYSLSSRRDSLLLLLRGLVFAVALITAPGMGGGVPESVGHFLSRLLPVEFDQRTRIRIRVRRLSPTPSCCYSLVEPEAVRFEELLVKQMDGPAPLSSVFARYVSGQVEADRYAKLTVADVVERLPVPPAKDVVRA